MDYPCGKFGDRSFSRFGSIVWTERHTYRQTDADECYTPTTLVSRSNKYNMTSAPRSLISTMRDFT